MDVDYTKLKSYSVNAISNILPLEKDDCMALVNYALTLQSDQDAQEHFMNLLGESDETYKFITNFFTLKNEAIENFNNMSKNNKRPKTGNHIFDEKSSENKLTNPWGVQTHAQSRKSPQNANAQRDLSKIKQSSSTSELADKQKSVEKISKKSKKKNFDNLRDVEAALAELELKGNDSGTPGAKVRYCNCMASKHPLYDVAPNCLNCGKIICAKEGLQPCSFCGSDILSTKERTDIIDVLLREKENMGARRTENKNEEPDPQTGKNKKKIVVSMNAGENLWKAQDRALKIMESNKKKNLENTEKINQEKEDVAQQLVAMKRYESKSQDPELAAAEENLEKLLHFQDTGLERTRIIDNAADFDLPDLDSGTGQAPWLSAAERALNLKKQQQKLRKYEATQKERAGRGEKTLEMVVKNGKVTMVEKQNKIENDPEYDKEIAQLEDEIRKNKKQEGESMQNNWDYENDDRKLGKPIYIGSGENTSSENADGDAFLLKSRVQFPNSTDTDEAEILANMY